MESSSDFSKYEFKKVILQQMQDFFNNSDEISQKNNMFALILNLNNL